MVKKYGNDTLYSSGQGRSWKVFYRIAFDTILYEY